MESTGPKEEKGIIPIPAGDFIEAIEAKLGRISNISIGPLGKVSMSYDNGTEGSNPKFKQLIFHKDPWQDKRTWLGKALGEQVKYEGKRQIIITYIERDIKTETSYELSFEERNSPLIKTVSLDNCFEQPSIGPAWTKLPKREVSFDKLRKIQDDILAGVEEMHKVKFDYDKTRR